MKREWKIGDTFSSDEQTWRVTDVGSRVIVAIRIDAVEVGGSKGTRIISAEEAEKEGWFKGPPFLVAEQVFDEEDQEGIDQE